MTRRSCLCITPLKATDWTAPLIKPWIWFRKTTIVQDQTNLLQVTTPGLQVTRQNVFLSRALQGDSQLSWTHLHLMTSWHSALWQASLSLACLDHHTHSPSALSLFHWHFAFILLSVFQVGDPGWFQKFVCVLGKGKVTTGCCGHLPTSNTNISPVNLRTLRPDTSITNSTFSSQKILIGKCWHLQKGNQLNAPN